MGRVVGRGPRVTLTPTAPVGVPVGGDLVAVTIDGFEVHVPKGTLLIRAAELVGIQVPRGDRKGFKEFLETLAYPCEDETDNPVYRLFLR